jgi:rare lipoprotein A
MQRYPHARIKSRAPRGLVFGTLLFIAACSGADRIVRDRAPAPIHPDDVAEAVPRLDPILAAGNSNPYTVNGVTYRLEPQARGYRAEGIASWYGQKFHGRKTANGEIFDAYGPTAAHRSLPIPCYVRVTNLDNDRSMIVRVNDRGPFHSERLIDLSYGAAVKLGFAERGTAHVRVEVIEPGEPAVSPDVPPPDDDQTLQAFPYRWLQLGAFSSEVMARNLVNQLYGHLGLQAVVSEVTTATGTLYRVRLGPFETQALLVATQQRLIEASFTAGQPVP